MALQQEWNFTKLFVDGSILKGAEWEIVWTDEALPGASVLSVGETLFRSPIDTVTATKAALIAATKSGLGETLEEIEANVLPILAHRYQVAALAEVAIPGITPTPEVPALTPAQIRLGLLSAGITEAEVDAALADNPEGMVYWKYATYYHRDHPLIAALGVVLGLPSDQIDSLWAYAADI